KDDRSSHWNRGHNLTVPTNRRFEFHKRRQYFIGAHNEPLSIVAMCINNPDCSPFVIHCRNAAPTPAGFAEIASDDFPVTASTDVATIAAPPATSPLSNLPTSGVFRQTALYGGRNRLQVAV